MKQLLTSIFAFFMAFFALDAHAAATATDDSYDELWNEVAKAFNNDLPKSSLVSLQKIRDKALTESNTPQLLRALATEVTITHQLSPDSNAVTISRVQAALDKEQRPVERALWQFVLGKFQHDNELKMQALSQPELLAEARAADYVPAFVLGHDSRCFNGDLLHVLSFSMLEDGSTRYADKQKVYNSLRDVYEKQGNDVAVLVADFLSTTEFNCRSVDEGNLIARIRALLPEIKKVDAASKGNLAAVMQEWICEKEDPDIRVNWRNNGSTYYPGDEIKVAVSSKNFAKMELRIYRLLKVTNETFNEDTKIEKIIKNRRRSKLVQTVKRDLQHTPAHKHFDDEFTLVLPESGIYIANLCVDGKSVSSNWFHVNNLAPVIFNAESAERGTSRLCIVDARTGQPITSGVAAKVRVKKQDYFNVHKAGPWHELTPDADGNFDVSDYDYNHEYAISVGDNHFYPVFGHPYYNSNGYSKAAITDSYVRLYTDRAIYRPGQKVQFGGVVYNRIDDAYHAIKGFEGKIVLQNAERKDIAEMSVLSDEYGQFNGEFSLPEFVVPGRFSIVFRSNSIRTTQYIQVEEYKRPTFRVKLEEVDCLKLYGRQQWAVGDTLSLRGLVECYSGVPIPEAVVSAKTIYQYWYWRNWDENSDEFAEFEGDPSWILNDNEDYEFDSDVVSDAEGRFELRIPLKRAGIYRTSAEALASNGETASDSHIIYVGEREVAPKDDAPEAPKPVLFKVENTSAGDEGKLVIDLRALPKNEEVPVYLFYDLVSDMGNIIETKRLVLNDLDYTYDLKWRPEYGQSAKAYFCFVKDGILYDKYVYVEQPKPDKRLLMEWSTFRDRLQPGQEETWSLTVKRPDGSPADASVMARLYDASLDAFASNPWNFGLSFYRRTPTFYGRLDYYHNLPVSYFTRTGHSGKELEFSHLQPSMFDYYANMHRQKIRVRGYSSWAGGANGTAPMMLKSSAAMVDAIAEPYAEESAMLACVADSVAIEELRAFDAETAAAAMQVKVRENFDETAFFMPCLRTDEAGAVTLNFTLPESLTQWNFTAFAHDKDMNFGILNDTIFAQKKLTAEIAAPRFLRRCDKASIPVTVRNLSEESLEGELLFLVSDAATAKPLKTEKRTFQLAEKNAATTFDFVVTATCDINVRAVAKAADFSDGEERNIPYFDGRETIQVSVPFSATQKGNIKVNLSTMNLARLMKQDALCKPQITVEYSPNPIWNVVRVVPSLLEGEAYSANDWATRLYAIEVGDFLAKRLQNTESGALVDSLLSAKDIPALRYSALDHLRDFQYGDGGFSWFRGFTSSAWITADVAVLLARQQKMTGSTTAQAMLDKAVGFLDDYATDCVKAYKKQKQPVISEVMLRYLYVRQLLGLSPDKDAKYLEELAAKEKKNLTMYGKSTVAQILQKSHPEESLLALQSLVEFTVSTEEMGRYFDTERAFSGWASYKIPTQTMAIEALGSLSKTNPGLTLSPDADDKSFSAQELQEQMKLWLLQSKRTQKWESSRASADATYALLHGDCSPQSNSKLFQTLSPENYSKRALSLEENAKAIASASYNINKESDGLSWGAVYADYTLPAEQVEQSSAGFTLTRKWEVLRGGQWIAIKGGNKPEAVNVGEHVRQIITLRADRDYDFVQVEASRAACLEPLQPLSGICWQNNAQCYRMVRDSRNDYFFEHLSKGTHTMTEELIVDRAGTFSTGIARVQCTFAPEFGGYAPSTTIFAKLK